MGPILATIRDCSAVIALRIGDYPKQLLADAGIECLITYNRISDAVEEAAEMLRKTAKTG
jgi:predicted Fe-Mo cluster-binding NifX family protein